MNYLYLFASLMLLVFCPNGDLLQTKSAKLLELRVDGDARHQTIHSFGASDAWSCQFVGANWPSAQKEQIADWLFSCEMEAGSPKGIGLSTWRFNIGGGSQQQGDSSGIMNEWRRAESFMEPDGRFNGKRQAGQRWFVQAAKRRGVQEFVGFVNSPPVALSKNGRAFSSDKAYLNLAEEKYGAYAEYLARVVELFRDEEGVGFDYISPVNEPQWKWTNGKQEGSPAQNAEIAALVREIDRVFTEKGIATKIEITESGQLNYLVAEGNRPGRGKQIEAFFDPLSVNYVGNLAHVAPKIAGHSYFTTWPLNKLVGARRAVADAIERHNIEFWMSEYCVLENNKEIKGKGKGLGMKTALYVARLMYADLVLAQASSWQWWLAVSPYNYKDGLVYIDKNKETGTAIDSKLLWAMGNYARFVRPGMQRYSVRRSDGKQEDEVLEDLMVSAYASGEAFTAVLVNYKQTAERVRFALTDFDGIENLKVYITDAEAGNNLKLLGDYRLGEVLNVPARAVLTLSNVE